MKPTRVAAPHLNTIITLCLIVIIVGAYVRISEAGLACPDWPLCHGQLVPSFNAPIFWEWLHRLLALVTFIYIVHFVYKMRHHRPRWPLAIILLIFLWQAALGALTVTQLLDPKIINLHFLNALLLLSFFVWFKLHLRLSNLAAPLTLFQLPSSGRYWLPLLTIVLLVQLALGSVVATTYSGYACPALLTCTGTWTWPHVVMQMWHMWHRLLGVLLLGMALCWWGAGRQHALLPPVTQLSCRGTVWLLGVQIGMGVLTVATGLHNALRLLHFVLGITTYLLLFAATCEYLLLWRKKIAATTQPRPSQKKHSSGMGTPSRVLYQQPERKFLLRGWHD